MRKGAVTAAALLLCLGAASGCSRCGRSSDPPPERFLAADASFAVVVPRLRDTQRELSSLSRAVLGFPAAAELSDALGALRARLGFDPFDPRVLEQAGLDPERGMGVAYHACGLPLVALPVADGRRLEAAVAYVAREKLGAGLRDRVRHGNVNVITFREREGAPPVLALAVQQGTALLSPGPDGPARVIAAADLSAAASLASSPAFGQARAVLGEGQALVAFAPAGSPALARLPFARDGAALGVTFSAARLAVRAALLLPAARAEVWRQAFGAGHEAGSEALSLLPADAFLLVRFGGDPAALARSALPHLPDGAATALARARLEAGRDLLAQLAPGMAASLSLAPTFDVAAVSRGAAQATAGDPFRLVHLAVALEVKDPRRAVKALERLAGAAPRLGLNVAPCKVRGLPGWRIARGAAEVRLALEGKRLFVAGGRGRLEALLARTGRGRDAGPSDAARAALGSGAVGGVIDFGQLVASFRALPPRAYGSGPDAYVMRSLAERIVDPASRLVAASLRLDVVEAAARFELVLEAQPEATPTETHIR